MLHNDLIIIPQSLSERIIKLAHKCPVGLNSSLRFLKNNYHIISLNKLVKNSIESCMACQSTTDISHYSPIAHTELPSKNFELVSIDFTSKLPHGKYIEVDTQFFKHYEI